MASIECANCGEWGEEGTSPLAILMAALKHHRDSFVKIEKRSADEMKRSQGLGNPFGVTLGDVYAQTYGGRHRCNIFSAEIGERMGIVEFAHGNLHTVHHGLGIDHETVSKVKGA